MELKGLTKKLLGIFGQATTQTLGEKLLDYVLSGDTEKYEKYCELVENDLDTDYINNLYQFFLADRENFSQDFTPPSLAKLTVKLVGGGNIYDMCAGTGSLSIAAWVENPDREFVCEELDCDVIPFLLFNLAVRNISGVVRNIDVLSREVKETYRLIKGEKFSQVIAGEDIAIKCKVSVSNPPYNIPWDSGSLKYDPCFVQILPPKNNANFAFVLRALSQADKVAVILPLSVGSNGSEQHIREYLIKKDWLEKVCILPEKLFVATAIGTAVWFFNKNKIPKNKAVIIDHRKIFDIEIRKQKGELHNMGRTYYKEIRVLSDEMINRILKTEEEKPLYSAVVTAEEFAENNFEILPGNYIKIIEERPAQVSIITLYKALNKIAEQKNAVKITINETIAKKLGWAEIKEHQDKENELTAEMQKMADLFNIKLEKSNYFTLSKKRNEIKIECQGDYIHPMLIMLLQSWQANFMDLNNRENSILAELRDGLLTPLMTGEISPPASEENTGDEKK